MSFSAQYFTTRKKSKLKYEHSNFPPCVKLGCVFSSTFDFYFSFGRQIPADRAVQRPDLLSTQPRSCPSSNIFSFPFFIPLESFWLHLQLYDRKVFVFFSALRRVEIREENLAFEQHSFWVKLNIKTYFCLNYKWRLSKPV